MVSVTAIGGCFVICAKSEYYYEQHFEIGLAVNSMGMLCGHHDCVAFVYFVFYSVYCDYAGTLKAGNKSVSAGLMSADFFAVGKSKQSDADCVILG